MRWMIQLGATDEEAKARAILTAPARMQDAFCPPLRLSRKKSSVMAPHCTGRAFQDFQNPMTLRMPAAP